jgi:predicted nucleic acid-binding protein
MKKIVVDSSVIIKWLNRSNEDHIEKADAILEDVHVGKALLLAPELAKHEVGKTLLYSKKLTQTESKMPLAALFELPIQYVSQTPELLKDTYAIAEAYGLTFNESAYLALAEQKGAVYITDINSKKTKPDGVKMVFLKDY